MKLSSLKKMFLIYTGCSIPEHPVYINTCLEKAIEYDVPKNCTYTENSKKFYTEIINEFMHPFNKITFVPYLKMNNAKF